MAARPADATNRTVANLDDSGAGSLRDLIAASGNGDSIDFAVTGTIVLTSGELVVNHNIAINGPGAASLTVARSSDAGTPGFRVFNFSTGTSGGPIASISGLTVSNGDAGGGPPANFGGGILNDHGSLTVNACTISGNAADYGGGLANYGLSTGSANLTVTGCAVSGNTAAFAGGGIYNAGSNGGGAATLGVTSSTLSGNSGNTNGGGGVYNSTGSCTIQSSTLTGNHDGGTGISGGGAIYNAGNGVGGPSADLQVIESTLANNSATKGGAIINFATGQNGHATATLTNCTLSGNTATNSGAAAYNTGSVTAGGQLPIATITFMSCTLSQNSPSGSGAGLTNFTSFVGVNLTLALGNTILSKAPGVLSSNIASGSNASVTSLGFNLCNDSGAGYLTASGDQINTDPQLDPSGLQSNGGPTQTIGLTQGSPAIDKGKSFGITVDQREQPRPIDIPGVSNAPGGDGSDIGAYEAPADPLQSGIPSFAVRLLDDHDDGVCAATDCTLREAIAAVQRRGGGSITFSTKTNNPIVLQGQLDINVPTAIQGNGARFTVISGNEAHRVFSFNAGTSTLSGVTIRDGWNAGSGGGVTRMGGGIYNQATLTLSDCMLTNNFVQGGFNNGGLGGAGGSAFGGAVYNSGSLTLERCTFYRGNSGNVAAGGGGANASGVGQSGGAGGDGAGGGVYNAAGASLMIKTSTFNGNSCAGGNGGNSPTSVGGNGGQGSGGAICNLGTMLVTAATVDGNFGAGGFGGTGSHGSNGGNGIGIGGVASIAGSSSTLGNTVSAGNSGASGGGNDADGSFISNGYNLIGTADHSTGFTATGDQTGTNASAIDPRLGPLQNNGGPTDTMALLLISPASPAIDKGKSFALTTDQRGLPRTVVSPLFSNAPGGDGSDIGSFEIQADVFPTPTATPSATATATATASPTGTPGQTTLANISTRLSVQTGDNVLIAGFIVTGTQDKKVIMRGVGPSLPLNGVLADPVLELYDGSLLLEGDDNWMDSPERQAILDSGIPPPNTLESAIVRTLPANGSAYTAILQGAGNGTGIGVVEVYDLDRSVDSKLANISTRGLVQTGDDVLIAGTIILGPGPQNVMVRAIGPSLTIPGKLANPTLELRDQNGDLIEANDNWVESPNKQAIIESTIPPTNDLESAIVQILPANGAQYTAIVRGVNDSTGIAVVEVYALN